MQQHSSFSTRYQNAVETSGTVIGNAPVGFVAWSATLLLLLGILLLSRASGLAASLDQFGTRPQGLIANVGQWPSHVLFLSRQAGSDVWITRSGVEIDRYTISASHQLRSGTVERQRFVDANVSAGVRSAKELYRINIICGTNPDQWISAPVYESAQISDFLPGVDVQFSSSEHGLERALVAGPGVNVSAFRMIVDGRESVRSVSVPSKKMLFESYIGGGGSDEPAGMARMSNGDVIVAGTTEAMAYDIQLGSYSKSINGNKDAFLVRLDKNLRRVVSYTFFGGQGNDRITDIVVGTGDEIFITGETESYDLPVSSTASSRAYKLETDAFIAGFDQTLSKVLFCTYHGGSGEDRPVSIALDAAGGVCVLGNTTSPRLPTTFPATVTGAGGGVSYGNRDMFVACFSKTGFLQKGRFIGSAGDDVAAAMVIDASSSLFIIGSTTTPSFAASAKGRFVGGKTDAFIMKFDQHLNTKQGESRLFGGTGDERPVDAVIDKLGRIVVAGITTSRDFPTLGEAGPVASGRQDVFFTIFAKDGVSIRQSGYIGGSDSDSVARVVVDPMSGCIVLLGQTRSFDFPLSEGNASSERSGETDGFIVKIDGTSITSSLLIGGNGADAVIDGWVDSLTRVVFVASTSSTDIVDSHGPFTTRADGSGIVVGRSFEGSISLSLPAGGETFCAGTMMPVRWASSALTDTVRYMIDIAMPGSGKWLNLVTNVAGSACHVRVPELPEGDYILRVTTHQGHLAQLMTPIRIVALPVVIRQPQSMDICGADSAVLSVSVRGHDLLYQWRRNGQVIPGATSSTLIVRGTEMDHDESFTCQITNPCGVRIESASSEVRLGQPPVITSHPTDQSVNTGSSFTLSVVAKGTDLTYRWWRNGMLLDGEESAVLRVSSATSNDQGWYSCSVTSPCGIYVSDTVSVRLLTTSVDHRVDAATTLRVVSINRDNDQAWLRLALEEGSTVHMRLIDIGGRVVSEQSMGALDRGIHDLVVPTGHCSPGLYSVVVTTDHMVLSASVVVDR